MPLISTPQRWAMAEGSAAASVPVVIAGTEGRRRNLGLLAAVPSALTRLAEALASAPARRNSHV